MKPFFAPTPRDPDDRVAPTHPVRRGRRGEARPIRWLAGAVALAALGCRGKTGGVIEGAFAIGVGAIPGSPNYAQVVEGVELAVARLNEDAGGPRFRVQLPDASVGSAVRVAQLLRDDPRVIAVVGHPESGNTLEAIPIYADTEHGGANGVVAVSPTSSSPRLSGISPWFFRVAPSDTDAARVTARWVLDSLGASRAAIVYRNDSYGRDWARTFDNGFVTGGGTVVMREPYLTGVVEWDAYATQLARLRPEVLLFPGDGHDALAFMAALRDRGVSIPFIGGDGTETMRQRAEAAGARYVSFFDEQRASSKEAMYFLPTYRARFQRAPDMFAALSYDATLVVGRTVSNGARTRRALRLALEQVGNGAPPVDGVVGPIAFEKNHDIKGRIVVITRVPAPVAASDARAPGARP